MKKPLTISDQGLFHAFLAERECAELRFINIYWDSYNPL
jgi:hypothetical protein